MDNTFKTHSLNVAAYLKTKGMNVFKTEKEGNRTAFYFESHPQLSEYIKLYNEDLELRKFISNYREIRLMTMK